MRFAKVLVILVMVTLGLGLVAMGVYTAYVARLWLEAMQS